MLSAAADPDKVRADPFALFDMAVDIPGERLRADAVYDVAAGRVDVTIYVLSTTQEADYT